MFQGARRPQATARCAVVSDSSPSGAGNVLMGPLPPSGQVTVASMPLTPTLPTRPLKAENVDMVAHGTFELSISTLKYTTFINRVTKVQIK